MELTMSNTPIELKLEVVVLPVTDVDRAKRFYEGLGWRLDADFPGVGDWRVVQMTPPGSPCSIHFGKGITTAAPGSAQNLYLVVSDIAAERADLVARGANPSDIFHFAGFGGPPIPEPEPTGRSYGSFASFSNPDGNSWLLQEIKTRLPGRGVSSPDIATLIAFLRVAEEHHGEYQATAPKHRWSNWYAAYIVARQSGRSVEDAAKDGAAHNGTGSSLMMVPAQFPLHDTGARPEVHAVLVTPIHRSRGSVTPTPGRSLRDGPLPTRARVRQYPPSFRDAVFQLKLNERRRTRASARAPGRRRTPPALEK
jgi:catechol 2,3-dioxygenase-like lactoylglutathione lyase family enzyme